MKKNFILLLSIISTSCSFAQGDNCVDATNLTIDNCLNFTNNEDDGVGEPSSQTCSNTAAQRADGWYKFTGNGQTLNLSYFADQQIAVGVYQTNCPTAANFHTAAIACQETAANAEGLLTFPTVNGTTYFVRIQRMGGAANTNQAGSICLYTNTGLVGKTCSQAQPKTVGTYCSSNSWVNNDDGTIVTNLSNPCGSTNAYQDIWFKVEGTGNPIGVNTFDVTGQSVVLSVYNTCPSYNNQNAIDIACTQVGTGVNGLGGVNFPSSNGTLYYVSLRRSSGNATDNQSGSICFYDYALGACGNNLGLLNDDCNNPAQIVKTPGSDLGGTTGGVFTADMGNGGSTGVGTAGAYVATGCFIIHNNSWYEFTANATTETFRMDGTTCSNIQAMVFQPIFNASGCCSTFVSKSACFGPTGTGIAGATITASGLSVGSKYFLMIDGYNGTDCDFKILDWGAPIGEVLGVVLKNFSALQMDNRNLIQWETSSETNNAYFEIHRSYDGEHFDVISTVEGNGTLQHTSNYQVEDYDIRFGTVYYKLNQVDFDGKSTYSNIIALERNDLTKGIIAIYPNPSNDESWIDINSSSSLGGVLSILSPKGQIMEQQVVEGVGKHQINLNLKNYEAGLYFVQYEDQEVRMLKPLVKN